MAVLAGRRGGSRSRSTRERVMPPANRERVASRSSVGPIVAGAGLALAAVGATILYKSTGAMRALTVAGHTSSLPAKVRWIPLDRLPEWAWPLADTLNYFSWIATA